MHAAVADRAHRRYLWPARQDRGIVFERAIADQQAEQVALLGAQCARPLGVGAVIVEQHAVTWT
ncbi:hypothetical protein D3C78_1089800 [compost metagenome]